MFLIVFEVKFFNISVFGVIFGEVWNCIVCLVGYYSIVDNIDCKICLNGIVSLFGLEKCMLCLDGYFVV